MWKQSMWDWCGSCVRTTWELCWSYISKEWEQGCDVSVGAAWELHGSGISVVWEWHGCRVGAVWKLWGNCLGVTLSGTPWMDKQMRTHLWENIGWSMYLLIGYLALSMLLFCPCKQAKLCHCLRTCYDCVPVKDSLETFWTSSVNFETYCKMTVLSGVDCGEHMQWLSDRHKEQCNMITMATWIVSAWEGGPLLTVWSQMCSPGLWRSLPCQGICGKSCLFTDFSCAFLQVEQFQWRNTLYF